jgi:hypothetical protein
MSMFTQKEQQTLAKAVAFLAANLDDDLIHDFADNGYDIISNETELLQLEAKISNIDPSSESASSATTTLLDTTIRDWRLSEGHAESDLKPEHLGNYALKLEMSNNSKQLWFSVYNKAFDRHPKDIHPSGLHGVLEIRDGLPALSVGIDPDANVIHIHSNTSNELAVVKEVESDKPTWKPIEFIDAKFTGLCFEVDDYETLMEARTLLAHDAFGGYDFGDKVVVEDDGWEVDDCHWIKTFYYENPNGGNSLKSRFELKFSHNGTVITDMKECK